MTFLRHAPRQVHHSVASYLDACLLELGWTAATTSERPFGVDRVKTSHSPAIVDGSLVKVEAGQVSITLGDEAMPEEQELGGPLSQQDYPIFIDVLMGEYALALTLASDIRDCFLGRFEFARRSIPVTDQLLQTPAPGWLLEFEDVERAQPDNVLPLHWQVVKVTAVATFSEARY